VNQSGRTMSKYVYTRSHEWSYFYEQQQCWRSEASPRKMCRSTLPGDNGWRQDCQQIEGRMGGGQQLWEVLQWGVKATKDFLKTTLVV
jgi:hypothetical protein